MRGLGELVEALRAAAGGRLPAHARRALARLGAKRSLRVAILSGRSLAALREKVRLESLWYAGNHGIEIQTGRTLWVHPEARADRAAVARVARGLPPVLTRFPGAFLEDKTWTLSLHAKQLSPGLSPRALRLALGRLAAPQRSLRVLPGKQVWEVRPRLAWDKGHALLRLSRLFPGARLAFVGDDATDEEGFKTLGARALCARVGPARRTRAGFALRDTTEVDELLAAVDGLWR